jgi:pimeloyl-ACP methyl ester carboxylesterase
VVREAGVQPERLILMGRSLGSGVATELAVRHDCALLVLISPYTSMVDMGRIVAGPVARLAVPDRYDNLAKITRVQCPAVILHGTRDGVIPVRMGRALAAAAGIALVEVPGASHNDFPGLDELVVREIGKRLPPP